MKRQPTAKPIALEIMKENMREESLEKAINLSFMEAEVLSVKIHIVT
jgi:hypothetical protein